MKKILITGKNSYVGKRLEKWLKNYSDRYLIDSVSLRDASWKEKDFSKYDVVFHVAGIAHVSKKPKLEELYYKVNKDLAIEVAQKAKNEDVKQFIFMSSIIIYGNDGAVGEKRVISSNTEFSPLDYYGRSKLEADLAIQELGNHKFKTVIIRAPVIYGPGCKGNFPKLVKLAKISPVFLNIENQRSMIYIDNLCEFLRLCVDNSVQGVFYPQNKEYLSTKYIINEVRILMGKKTLNIGFINSLVILISKKNNFINKVFGNKVYDITISNHFDWEYEKVELKESIKRTIGK
ncbi:NAD-dependent epimerase/dehydratase family protein [Thalassobacillus devorans]|uniref:NAD-dependent epimerase/dehydratase family protein n=1 Tax=Thalassobacillus devorans TaxID=279813 RepID=UPI000A1CADD6|nr:NAD-dependent epimerase/dehydratase family protein [Thalassobacillus devorans]